MIGEQAEYEVEWIIDQMGTGKDARYWVSWKGYTPDDDTWEPESNLTNTKAKLKAFLNK
ncbi:hypothetical protein LPJ59_005351, partial [Coemansia sp. RSA 2399]